MPIIPALCNRCGAFFNSGIMIEDSIATLEGNVSGPCPICGSMGRVPDGLYKFTKDTIEILSAPSITYENLKKLLVIIEKAKVNHYQHEQIEKEISGELPELKSIIDVLPKTRSELYGFITVLILVITTIMNQFSLKDRSDDSNKMQIINNVYNNSVVDNNQRATTPCNNYNAERNELCPCGSGLKFKKCHGK